MKRKQNELPRRLYSAGEWAQSLGMSERHIRNLVALGELKAYRVGRRIGISPEQIDDFLKKNSA